MTLCYLAAALNVLILLQTTAYSLSTSNKQKRTGENEITFTEADSELSSDFNTPLEIVQLQTELASLSIHSYLKELYINLTNPFESSLSSKKMEVSAIHSYKNQIKCCPCLGFSKNGNCGYYKFDVDKHETNYGEQTVQAELRLLQTKSPTLDDYYNVDIYYLLNETHWSPIPISYEYIDSAPGWKTFDITPIVNNWKQGLVNHHGIQLKLTDKAKEALPCEGVFSAGEEDPINTEPLLIVYANDYSISKKSLRKRDIASDEIDEDIPRSGRGCRRKNLVVTLSDLIPGVLLPKIVNIGICEGQCTYASQGNPSYSDILDLYYQNSEGSAIPEKCCVPASFRYLSIISYDVNNTRNRLFKTQLPIMVTSCSCL